MTFITRPSVPRPTGTEIGPPWSIAFIPRTIPSVACIATQRTRPSPKCCWTSRTTLIGAHLESIADDSQGLIDRRHVGGRKLHVYSRTGNLNNVSNIFWHKVRLAFVSLAISIQHSAFSTAISLPKP